MYIDELTQFCKSHEIQPGIIFYTVLNPYIKQLCSNLNISDSEFNEIIKYYSLSGSENYIDYTSLLNSLNTKEYRD